MSRAGEVSADIAAAQALSDYEAVEVLWVALVKAANGFTGKDEQRRMRRLCLAMPASSLKAILHDQGVETLLALDPPLETILADPRERLQAKEAADAVKRVKALREKDPHAALAALG